MKQIIYILLMLGICSCKNKTQHANEITHVDTFQAFLPKAQVMDSLPPIPKEIIQKEYFKSLNVHSWHSLVKEEFAFNEWLTDVKDIDSIQNINSHIDSLGHKVNYKRDSRLNLADEWHLKYLLMKGWYEQGMERTKVNKCFVSKANKYRLSGDDLTKIFKKTKGWTFLMPSENELIIRCGFWYPNGNQTSWDYNHFYYFSKLQLN
jgi:hypothetical protein